MMPEEKEKLVALFNHESRWCREAEARNVDGEAVCYDDQAAVAWDVTGAICRLFGWQRACVLFEQFDRHVNGKRVSVAWPAPDAEMVSMGALQEFNDRDDTTFATIRQQIDTMPIWPGNIGRSTSASGISQA